MTNAPDFLCDTAVLDLDLLSMGTPRVSWKGKGLALGTGFLAPVLVGSLFSLMPNRRVTPLPKTVTLAIRDLGGGEAGGGLPPKPEPPSPAITTPASEASLDLATLPAAPPTEVPMQAVNALLPTSASPVWTEGWAPVGPSRPPTPGTGRGTGTGTGKGNGGPGSMFSRSSIDHGDALMVAPEDIQSDRVVYPAYPPACIFDKVQGDVVINYLVDEKGHVVRWQVVSSVHPKLLEAVKEVAGEWRFAPMKVDGRPVRVAFDVTFRFILRPGR